MWSRLLGSCLRAGHHGLAGEAEGRRAVWQQGGGVGLAHAQAEVQPHACPTLQAVLRPEGVSMRQVFLLLQFAYTQLRRWKCGERNTTCSPQNARLCAAGQTGARFPVRASEVAVHGEVEGLTLGASVQVPARCGHSAMYGGVQADSNSLLQSSRFGTCAGSTARQISYLPA